MDGEMRVSQPEELALIRRAQAGDQGAASQLLDSLEGLIHQEARRFAGPRWHNPEEREDYLQAGRMGAWRAVAAFDVQRCPDGRLTTFAMYHIRSHVCAQLRTDARHGRLMRLATDWDGGDDPLAAAVPDHREVIPGQTDGLSWEELCDLTTSSRERDILRRLYGLDGCDPAPAEVVGAELHLSRRRVYQIAREALGRLRRRLAHQMD